MNLIGIEERYMNPQGMRTRDIERDYTRMVSRHLDEGYVVNSSTMCQFQGELCKIDLVKNDVLVRLCLEAEHSVPMLSDDQWYGNKIVLRVYLWKYPASYSKYRAAWKEHMELIEEYVYYGITPEWYTAVLDDALRIQRLRKSRVECSRDFRGPMMFTKEKAIKIAIKYLRRLTYYNKPIDTDKVRVLKWEKPEGVTYIIEYYGFTYKLH